MLGMAVFAKEAGKSDHMWLKQVGKGRYLNGIFAQA